jgi:hypothetical protein
MVGTVKVDVVPIDHDVGVGPGDVIAELAAGVVVVAGGIGEGWDRSGKQRRFRSSDERC